MTNKAKTWEFKAEEIFEDIPDDPENINMKIPDEVAEEIGLKPGDTVKVYWGDKGSIVITKAEMEADGQE